MLLLVTNVHSLGVSCFAKLWYVMLCYAMPCYVCQGEIMLSYRLRHLMALVGAALHRTLLGVTNPLGPILESAEGGTVSHVRDVRGLVP
jgi:hypothetical protein